MSSTPDALISFAARLAPGTQLDWDALRASVADPAMYARANAEALAGRGIRDRLPANLPWLALVDALIDVGRAWEIDWKEDPSEVRAAIESIAAPPLEDGAFDALDDIDEVDTEAFLKKCDRALRGVGRALVQLDIGSDSYPLVVVQRVALTNLVRDSTALGLGRLRPFLPVTAKVAARTKEAPRPLKPKVASRSAVKEAFEDIRYRLALAEDKGGLALLTAPSAPSLALALARAYLTLDDDARARDTLKRAAVLRLRAIEERQRMYGHRPEHSRLRYDYGTLEEDAAACLTGAFEPIGAEYDRWGIEEARAPYSHLGAIGARTSALFRGQPFPPPSERNVKDAKRWKYNHVFEALAAASARDAERLASPLTLHLRRFLRDYDGKQTGWTCFFATALLRVAGAHGELPEDVRPMVPPSLLAG